MYIPVPTRASSSRRIHARLEEGSRGFLPRSLPARSVLAGVHPCSREGETGVSFLLIPSIPVDAMPRYPGLVGDVAARPLGVCPAGRLLISREGVSSRSWCTSMVSRYY